MALKQLKAQTEVVIKPTDKRGNIVLMSHQQYQHMCYDVLNNKQWYHPIDSQVVLVEFSGVMYQNIFIGAD